MKKVKNCIAYIVATVMCVTAASAHTHTLTDSSPGEAPVVSPWAQEEVDQAIASGLMSTRFFEADYRKPITREQFAQIALEYVSRQAHFDSESLIAVATMYAAEKDENGDIKAAFTDVDHIDINIAHSFGLVQGRGDGTFGPDESITRQEAAVMLARAYEVCGGNLSDTAEKSNSFIDFVQIADWAQESTTALATLGVINGMEDGTFSPKGWYSIEQCLITFLRLHEMAPVSLENDASKTHFTYEQCMAYLDSLLQTDRGRTEVIKVEGPTATFIRHDAFGWPTPGTRLYLVYADGGMVRLADIGLCTQGYSGRVTPALTLEDCSFSEDGRTLSCRAILPTDVTEHGEVWHEKGAYQITIDVNSCKYEVAYQTDSKQ